jgi:hypothetical protein
MRYSAIAALLLLAAATPAQATGGIDCRPVSGRGPTLHLVIGHGVAPALVSVRMTDGLSFNSGPERMGSNGLTVVQSWMDRQVLWLDLADPNVTRFEGRLRATFQPRLRGRPAIGTFVRNGRTYRMRCVEG